MGRDSTKTTLAALSISVGLILLSQSASASPVVLPFPGPGTTYSSATNGSGTIPSGGQSGYMWTAGDNVDETFNGTGLTFANSLSFSFDIQNYLNGFNETVDVLINSILVDSFTALDCSECGSNQLITDSVSFGNVVGNGTYELSLVLQDTIPGGGGSIAFLDGGTFTLNGVNAVPEPATLTLFGVGLFCIGALRRRKGTKVAVR